MSAINRLTLVVTSFSSALFGAGSTADKLHVGASNERLRDIGVSRDIGGSSHISRVNGQVDRTRLNAWI